MLWLLRLAYVVIELFVVAATDGYHLVDDTVSDLGTAECGPGFCSPRHELMNGTFIGIGLLLAVGAVLLAPRLGRLVTVLLVVAGLSSVATGYVPVDQDPSLHALVAAPLFVCQPLALLLLGRTLRPTNPRVAAALVVTGLMAAAGAAGFVLGVAGTGVLERLALWPVLGAFAAAGVVLARQTAQIAAARAEWPQC